MISIDPNYIEATEQIMEILIFICKLLGRYIKQYLI